MNYIAGMITTFLICLYHPLSYFQYVITTVLFITMFHVGDMNSSRKKKY